MLAKTKKKDIVHNFERHQGDTGSPDVQIALLTERINQLTRHMATSKHDYATQRALLILVGKRRRLLNYLSKEDVDRYHKVIGQLNLRK